MTCVTESLAKMSGLSKARRTFMSDYLSTLLAVPGRVNFRNMSRYGTYCEKTYARHFAQSFDYATLNALMIEQGLGKEVIAAMDATFLPKSGKKTYGLDRFFDSRIHKCRRGLELSLFALIDVATERAFALSARQTPPSQGSDTSTHRMAHYTQHYRETLAHIPERVRYIVADGAYARKEFIEDVRSSDRHLVTRLRCDANLRYLYRGPQRGGRGRIKRYAGKVDLSDASSMDFVKETRPGIKLYTALVNSPHFKQDFRIAVLYDERNPEDKSFIALASTDLSLAPETIVEYYCLRFHIEFLFRDSKQYTGLTQCQARSQAKLDFHFNASLCALNVARLRWHEKEHSTFSMASIKRITYNELFMEQIFFKLGIEPELIKNLPAFEELRCYGAIAA
jgi:IS4 transposase